MKKVLFTIGSLQVGGAETVMVDIINHIYNEFDITVLLVSKHGELVDRLNNNVIVKYLTLGNEYCNNFLSTFYNKIKRSLIYRFLGKNSFFIKLVYKHLLKKSFDVEIAFLPGLSAEIVKRSPNKHNKKVAWIHSEAIRNYNTDFLTIINGFDKIIGNCNSSIYAFERCFPNYEGQLELIYNYIDTDKIINKSNEKIEYNYDNNTKNFLSLGRIVDGKGFDRILDISKKYGGKINFYIGGTGPLEEEYNTRIKNENIKNVHFIGLKKNPYPYIKQADAFLMVSESEAFPTVVIEAMILNKSIIATEVLGIHEILDGYDNKIIVKNNTDAIINGIDKWLTSNQKNNKKSNSTNNFIQRNEKELDKIKNMLSR